LNKKNNIEIDTKQNTNEEPQNNSDLKDVFYEHENSKIIEKEYEALLKNIESIVISSFLRKEFYENLPD
jgi:hypothetical protein